MSQERRGRRSFGPRREYGARRDYGPRRDYGSRREGGFPPKPVEVGKEYDVEIQEVSRRGEGIARIKGLVCFVPNTKTGDHVKIRINRISSRFAEAEVVGKGEATETAETTEEAEETTETAETTEEAEDTEEDE